jgi:hypothetical protein
MQNIVYILGVFYLAHMCLNAKLWIPLVLCGLLLSFIVLTIKQKKHEKN